MLGEVSIPDIAKVVSDEERTGVLSGSSKRSSTDMGLLEAPSTFELSIGFRRPTPFAARSRAMP